MRTPADDAPPAPNEIDVMAEACSHQLGEAVTIITGYVGVLRESGMLAPATLRAVDGGVDRVRRVVEDLLDLTRVAGRPAGHERVALEQVVVRALDELGDDALLLDVRTENLPVVVGDEEQLACALRQLLRAAAAARGPDQGHVHVTITAAPLGVGWVRLSLVDDAAAPPGLVGGLARGRGPLVGAGAAELIVHRIAVAHGGGAARASADGSRVGFDVPVPR